MLSGLVMRQKRCCNLAFFSVVASSPNLSTFITLQKYLNYSNLQNIFFFVKQNRPDLSMLLKFQ